MTNTTTTTTAQAIQADAAKALKAHDAKALKALYAQALGLESLADGKALESRTQAQAAIGDILAACVTLATPDQDLHTVPQQAIADAAAKVGITVTRNQAKVYVRVALYCTPDRIADAKAKAAKADGPASLAMRHVLPWCQAQDAAGRAAATRSGQAVPTKAQALKAVTKASADAKATKAKADADAAKVKRLADGHGILSADADDVFGPLSAGRWQALDVKALDGLIETAQAVKAAKVADAKAAKAAKAKAPKAKAPKADADATPNLDDIVAQAVAAALKAAGVDA